MNNFCHPFYATNHIYQPLRSLTGLNSEFFFSLTSCLAKAEEPSPSYNLPIAGGRIIGFIPFPKSIIAMWNAISLVQGLNSCLRVYFLQR